MIISTQLRRDRKVLMAAFEDGQEPVLFWDESARNKYYTAMSRVNQHTRNGCVAHVSEELEAIARYF
jgi:hypothetical protein